MARLLRIDQVRLVDGKLHVAITSGRDAVQATPSKRVLVLGTKADVAARLVDFENSVSDEELVLLALAAWRKTDATLSDLTAARGKTVQLSLSSGADLVQLR